MHSFVRISLRPLCMCGYVDVCVALSDREVAWWGLHPKKGFLSRWHLQDWQDAILHWNSVSQPASLSARQPLTPLNLAFCWAVTGLASTLHVAILINCTVKPSAAGTHIDGLSLLWCRYKWLKQLCPLFLLFLYLSLATHIVLFTSFTLWHHLLSAFSVIRTRSGFCAGNEMTFFPSMNNKKKEVSNISCAHTL